VKTAGEEFLTVLHSLCEAVEGEVIMIAGGGRRASTGEIFATEALRKGVAGIVVDGALSPWHPL
jgi:4-hydroxy-4-methyl-2-oxoglutarate aldolase